MPENGLLAIFAHPDDETFGVGGCMAHYAERGLPVTMICATRGEVGEIAPGTDATPETLGRHREQELRDAMAILGVSDVRFMGFRDSGMHGTPDNDDPRAYSRAHPDAAVHILVRAIRELRPAVIVTWDASGGYGHPDHIASHEHATAAFYAAADPSRFPSSGEPWRAKALYYTSIPIEEFGKLMEEMRKQGMDVPEFTADERIASLPRVPANCIIDVGPHFEQKERAMLSHRTQLSDIESMMKLPDEVRRRFFGREFFYRAHPPLPDGDVIDDFFARL
jgi:LmbE family N-acetylglucosaminyl deacetylase